MPGNPPTISTARSEVDIAAIRALFRSYEAAIGVDLCFQGFEEELRTLPGKYAAPTGELLLARNSAGEPIGCVALRPTDSVGICEMKRLYVEPEARGSGLGRKMVAAILDRAKAIGYREMRLDTLPAMSGAIALYRSFGFEEIPQYYETPIGCTLFLGKSLM
jgi:ribosomal protein S18 acetylase RimI-like enzyme